MNKNTNPYQLYKISADYEKTRPRLMEIAEEGLLSADELERMLQQIERPLVDGIIDIAADFKNTEKQIKAMKEYENEMKERRSKVEKYASLLKAHLQRAMEKADLNKVNGGEFTVSLRKSPPSVNITEEAEIPDQFLKVSTTPDKAKIKKFLESTADFGCDWANLSQKTTVTIK